MHCANGTLPHGILEDCDMTSPISLSIKMYGAFRKYHPDILNIEIPDARTAQDVKSAIAVALRSANPAFNDDELMRKSALANQQRVFKEDDLIVDSCALAILPPVCGG